MEAENVSFDDSGERKVIEQRGEVLPHASVTIFSKAFIIESINSINGSALMITSEKEEVFRILDLISE